MSAGIETMAYFGETPWHNLGVSVKTDDQLNWKVFAEKAKLDWEVQLNPVYERINYEHGSTIRNISDKFSVMRKHDEKHLGVVGAQYAPIQNSELFEFFDPFVQNGLARYHTAGSLHGGKGVWVLAQIGNLQEVVDGDMVGQFMLMSSSHNGSHALRVTPTTIRVVCANTNGLAVSNAQGMKTLLHIKHTKTAQIKIAQLQEIIKPSIHDFNETIKVFRTMSSLQTWDPHWFLEKLWPTKNLQDKVNSNGVNNSRKQKYREKIKNNIIDIYNVGGMGGLSKSRYSLFNAITQYMDHEHGRTADSRMNSAWFGNNAQIKATALKMLAA